MRWLVLVVLLLAVMPAVAQDATPPLQLRVTLAPEDGAFVGQRVRVTVTLLTPIRFAAAPAFPDLTFAEGRAIVLPEATTTPGSERVGNETLAALQRSYSVFPATTGPIVIAPVHVTARVGGEDGRTQEAEASSAPLRLTARLPHGVRDPARLVVAPEFRLTAETPDLPETLRIGDAVRRVVRMEARDVVAMLLPPPAFGDPAGLRAYPDPPRMEDRSDRGALRAIREDSVTFVPQRAGTLEVPGYAVQWLEPRSGRLREMRVEPVTLQVEAAQITSTSDGLPGWVTWVAATAVAGLGLAMLQRRRRGSTRPAEAHFAALAVACRANHGRAALVALYRWIDAAMPAGSARRVALMSDQTGVPALEREAAKLEAVLLEAGANATWEGAPLLDAAMRAHQAANPRLRGAGPALPPLNPSANAPNNHAIHSALSS